ncbi:transferrin-binding protein-like solute binding protein [uncultured Cardiobacterium sp.]|uniref:transferrin-binding protein-like solute binding protein n=1 Tax=uncultured Cardiobacterium sp. TaxID=417619 RepID=UPI002637C256|nr:transferrin-binding protein-like solute binding protein [uncultured Cardiobacterium sp.]
MSDLESPPNEYSIGAVPTTLKYVQYGRVTTKLDLADGENLLDNGFLRAPLTYKNDPNGVDHYFFRGVNATSIEQMAALPSDAVFQYSGHALMYGINNRFHGITGDANNVGGGHSLPNAFSFDQAKMGLGNFVDATFNVGQKKVTGDVYNAWLQSLDKPTVLKDKLVHFQGDVIGNTIVGTADRAYIPGNDEAAFRGAFNSVKPDDKYGSAYEYGDWGGVFGAAKTGGSGGNTFQGDDSNNVYGNNNP